MEQRIRATHKDGFRTWKILEYGSQDLNFATRNECLFDLQRKRLQSLVLATLDFYLYTYETWLVAILPSYFAFNLQDFAFKVK